MNIVNCPECGCIMTWEVRKDILTYKGHTKTVPLEGLWCNSCPEGIFTGDPLVENERQYLAFKAEIDGRS